MKVILVGKRRKTVLHTHNCGPDSQEGWKIVSSSATLVYFFFFYLVLAVLGLCCCMDFSLVAESGSNASCSVQASHCDGFSCCEAWAPEHRLTSHDTQV